jgi:hypothetical protein
MANLTERITMLELRMRYIEEVLGVEPTSGPTTKPIKQEEPVEEETINGFTKSQLRVMYGWAKSFKLQQLTRGDFEELKKWGMLWEFFPNAPQNYDDITL